MFDFLEGNRTCPFRPYEHLIHPVFIGPPHSAAARLQRGMTTELGAFVLFVFSWSKRIAPLAVASA
jgi:hypothetical protein